MISTSLLFTILADLFIYDKMSSIMQIVQTYSGVYLCKRTIFWTFRPNAKICWQLTGKVYIFYIMQLPIHWSVQISLVSDRIFGLILKIRPNSGLILKIRTNNCCHLKKLCKLGLRPEIGLRTKPDLFYQVIHCTVYSAHEEINCLQLLLLLLLVLRLLHATAASSWRCGCFRQLLSLLWLQLVMQILWGLLLYHRLLDNSLWLLTVGWWSSSRTTWWRRSGFLCFHFCNVWWTKSSQFKINL